MSAILILQLVCFVVVFGVWIGLIAEAFRHSPGQALMTLFIPGYVLYFLFIRSRCGRVLRLTFVAAIATWQLTS